MIYYSIELSRFYDINDRIEICLDDKLLKDKKDYTLHGDSRFKKLVYFYIPVYKKSKIKLTHHFDNGHKDYEESIYYLDNNYDIYKFIVVFNNRIVGYYKNQDYIKRFGKPKIFKSKFLTKKYNECEEHEYIPMFSFFVCRYCGKEK